VQALHKLRDQPAAGGATRKGKLNLQDEPCAHEPRGAQGRLEAMPEAMPDSFDTAPFKAILVVQLAEVMQTAAAAQWA
jgi:hypothetical protein